MIISDKGDMKVYVTLSLLIFISFFCGYIVGGGLHEYSPPEQCFIPGPEQVDKFCEQNGYNYGWLSMACGANKVTCYKDLGENMYTAPCIEWVTEEESKR